MKKYIEKIYDKSPLFIYILWFLGCLIVGFFMFYYGTTISALRAFYISLAFSTIFSFMPTWMIYVSRKTQKFYDELKTFKTKAEELSNEDDLIVLKDDLIDFCKERSFHITMTEEVEKVLIMINTRLDCEFDEKCLNKKIEYIICSAVKFDYNGQKDIVICGRRHKDCHDSIKALVPNIKKEDEPTREQQGFMTNRDRYVGRKEAYEIADKAKQLLLGANQDPDMRFLTSEDLY